MADWQSNPFLTTASGTPVADACDHTGPTVPACNGKINGAHVARDRAGLIDDQTCINAAGVKAPSRENVSLLDPAVTASMLGQFVSLVVAPGGVGVPDPLRFSLSRHTTEHMPVETPAGCGYEQAIGHGDRCPTPTKQHPSADAARQQWKANTRALRVRGGAVGRLAQDLVETSAATVQTIWAGSKKPDHQRTDKAFAPPST